MSSQSEVKTVANAVTSNLSPEQMRELAALIITQVSQTSPAGLSPIGAVIIPSASAPDEVVTEPPAPVQQLSGMDLIRARETRSARKSLGAIGAGRIARGLLQQLQNGDPNPDYDPSIFRRLRHAIARIPGEDPAWDAYWLSEPVANTSATNSHPGDNHD
jgi:hypothetical protein